MQEGSALGHDATTAPAAYWQAGRTLEDAMAAKTGPAAIAIRVKVNHGRWIEECPDCCGAQLATKDDRRFMCNYCGNAAVGGLWRPVVWPKNTPAIEAALAGRPVANRNWSPDETIQTLRDDNEVFLAGAGV